MVRLCLAVYGRLTARLPWESPNGVALALLTHHRTGRGQKVEASLLHMALAMQSVDLVRVEHEAPEATQTDYSRQALYSPYQCSDGKYLILVVLNNDQFHQLCHALQLDHLIGNPRYGSNLDRAQHSRELYSLVEGILSTGTRDEWLQVLEQHDVPSMPILEREEVFQHPQIRENQMIATIDHP